MGLFEIIFKVRHDCPFGNLSIRFPSMKMFVWCNSEHDVIEIVADTLDYENIRRELDNTGIIAELTDEGKVHLITKKCTCSLDYSVACNIDKFNLLQIFPDIIQNGWVFYRVIAFKHIDVKRFFDSVEKKGLVAEVLRKVPFDGFIASSLTLTADALFSNLTEKQIDALLGAYSHGYYRLPRKSDVKKIASKRRVPRTTFEEHLRKAENKIIAGLVPYLQLFNQAHQTSKKKLVGKPGLTNRNP